MGCGASSVKNVLEPGPGLETEEPTRHDVLGKETCGDSSRCLAFSHCGGTLTKAQKLGSTDAKEVSQGGTREEGTGLEGLTTSELGRLRPCDTSRPSDKQRQEWDSRRVTPPEVLWQFFLVHLADPGSEDEVPHAPERPLQLNELQCASAQSMAQHEGCTASSRSCPRPLESDLSQARSSELARGPEVCSWKCGENEGIPRCLASRLRRHNLSTVDDEFQIRLDDLRASAASDSRLADVQALLAVRPAVRTRPPASHVSMESGLLPAEAHSADFLTLSPTPVCKREHECCKSLATDSIEHGWRSPLKETKDEVNTPNHGVGSCARDQAPRASADCIWPSPFGPVAQKSGSPGGIGEGLRDWQGEQGCSSRTASSEESLTDKVGVAQLQTQPHLNMTRRSTATRHPMGPR